MPGSARGTVSGGGARLPALLEGEGEGWALLLTIPGPRQTLSSIPFAA
jgi:hypothetical protein